jgi:ankyrin repeat protein
LGGDEASGAQRAKANQVDDLGKTPLQYAKTVDDADSTFAELLLAAGADTKANDKQVHTAMELAKEYKHGAAETVLAGKTPER